MTETPNTNALDFASDRGDALSAGPLDATPQAECTSMPSSTLAEGATMPSSTLAESATMVSLEASLRIAGTFVFVAILVHLLRGDPPVPLRPMQVVADRSFVQQETAEAPTAMPQLDLKPAPRVQTPIRALPASFLPQGN